MDPRRDARGALRRPQRVAGAQQQTPRRQHPHAHPDRVPRLALRHDRRVDARGRRPRQAQDAIDDAPVGDVHSPHRGMYRGVTRLCEPGAHVHSPVTRADGQGVRARGHRRRARFTQAGPDIRREVRAGGVRHRVRVRRRGVGRVGRTTPRVDRPGELIFNSRVYRQLD